MDQVLRPSRMFIAALLAIVLASSACSATSSSSPATSPGASPAASAGPVTTAEDAVARVVAKEPRFAGIGKRDPDMIGQASWYDVTPASGVGAFVVTVRVGWGDCPSGCIDEHTWVYAVAPDGAVTLQSEDGSDVPPEAWPAQSPGGGAAS